MRRFRHSQVSAAVNSKKEELRELTLTRMMSIEAF